MNPERHSNRSYSNERRSNTTPLVLAAIVLVVMVSSCLVATRDNVGVDRPAPPPNLEINR